MSAIKAGAGLNRHAPCPMESKDPFLRWVVVGSIVVVGAVALLIQILD